MSGIFYGLNPLKRDSGCYYTRLNSQTNKQDLTCHKPDILFAEMLESAWNQRLGFIKSLKITFLLILGDHQATNIQDPSSHVNSITRFISNPPPFKGALDFLLLPLVARKLLNWSLRQMENKSNSFSLEIAISFARVFAGLVIAARYLISFALTVALLPVIGITCALRSKKEKNNLLQVDIDTDYQGDELPKGSGAGY
ncbi:MAG: hypothetical protein P1U74_07455 [Legionellaceae bacterium]|nr:hypothetical protein [Legionellaceae bacterium]